MDTHLYGGIDLPFAGDERRFRLGLSQLLALEERRECGFAALHMRLVKGMYGAADITEILRLGLIGGGTSERLARELVERSFLTDGPSLAGETALCVLTAAIAAPKGAVLAGKLQAGSATPPNVSIAPSFTETA